MTFSQSPPLDLQQPVKAMTPSFDGKTFFVLGQDSNLYIYNAMGQKQGQTKVDPSMDMISISGFKKANIPEFIFLSSSTTGAIQRITYDQIATFDVAGSPFMGNPDAKVTVVIFSDFQ
jgi:predicted membrane GTPase involved in stress response